MYCQKLVVLFFAFHRAVVNHSAGQDLPFVSVESFVNLPGRGLSATLSRIEVSFCELDMQELRFGQLTYKMKNLYLSPSFLKALHTYMGQMDDVLFHFNMNYLCCVVFLLFYLKAVYFYLSDMML